MPFILIFTMFTTLTAEDINLNVSDIHIDEWSKTFATRLNDDYSIVVSVDYDDRSMSAIGIDNKTKEIYCLPEPCRYNR